MNNERRFTYKGKHCLIFYSANAKRFYLNVFTNESYTELENAVSLFPVKRFSESSKEIAFHVANLHVLPKWFN